uniref:Protein kinase domain-containing protein n=1 Tax=Entomoneis paludosa TaxID=265537 RepID=A0A7S2Y4M6_9STRA|mmetsp:Transcript_17400/g.36057  ORF Transcript_17400/g.36057 Transcript_17400/m.36057 type:complete len:706 (+) Transcript_17400:119-2236(+)|eukprot:CAMPEP_0172451588 /NCGR_PEP_ID=MMETSP1065-20121228/9571_1 /TAXON_ID=265537 /ORGANISM="Amphiprora paludosa, Strain CCMP125" /LENGTH=705 /DNA_ID=CAMNT_0013203551 /DNA_START=107 /DNA_END=2224 /DNA_ORIENTATION=-
MPEEESGPVEQPGISFLTKDGTTALAYEDFYEQKDRLASGSFGTVYVAEHRGTKEEYAVKVVDRSRLSEKDHDLVNREVGILKDCRDIQSIVRLIDFFESPSHYYVVQVYARGGDVFERLASTTIYSEKHGRDLAIHLLRAMQHLHKHKIAHRDLKPENLLLLDKKDDSTILVADFGFAKYVPDDLLRTRCGTPAFVAPELLVNDCRYDERVDMWSVGCLLYMLLGGYPPFQDKNHQGLFRKIRGADFTFHDAYWKNVSIPAKRLIANLLTTDPNYRISAKSAVDQSQWLKLRAAELEGNNLDSSLPEFKKFHSKRTLKGAASAVLWSVKATKMMSSRSLKASDLGAFGKSDDEKAKRVDDALFKASKSTVKFLDVYDLNEKLHKSSSAQIWACTHKETKDGFAVKIIPNTPGRKSVTGKSVSDAIHHELAVLKSCKHSHIIEIIDFFEDDDNFYLVMERMDGGDVFDRIIDKQKYTEKDARDLSRFLLEAVHLIHSKDIAHRDLKPQNILLKSKESNADIKLADFGFACRVHTPQSLTTRCGTPTYVAPEILKNIPYDQSSDMWSVGVILYVLLVGYPPFASENQNVLFQKIRTADFTFREAEWSGISDEAKNLIKNLLVVDPLQRWTAKIALNCDWFKADEKAMEGTDLSGGAAKKIRERKRRFFSVAKSIMWMKASSRRVVKQDEAPLDAREFKGDEKEATA